MSSKTIMLIGAGIMGGYVLDMLCRSTPVHEIIVAGRNEQQLLERSNLSTLVANHLGYFPNVKHAHIDLWNVDQTSETIARLKPDIIFNAACIQSWWLIGTLPKPIYKILDASQVGPWLPMHLTLAYKLMQAVKQAGLDIDVVNGSYPDVVNPILAKIGLAPKIGIGNIANTVPALKRSLAQKLNAHLEDIDIRLFMHHYVSHRVSRLGNSGGAPFHLTILLSGEDISQLVDMETVWDLLPTRFKRSGGPGGTPITAASAMTVIDSMANNKGKVVHAPGPNGLPGGYAVRVDEEKVEVALPDTLTLESAIRINTDGMCYDGIEKIDTDGRVHFTEREMSILRDVLGYYRRSMTVDESEDCAEELRAKYLEYAAHFN